MLLGIVYAFMLLDDNNLNIIHIRTITSYGVPEFLLQRMIITLILSFVLSVFTIILVNPVPTQGWLRIVFAALLFSVQSPFVFLFISALAKNRVAGLAYSRFFWIILIALPLGLMFHHPWNYFAFFSPWYWTAWAWIISSSAESMVYGSIAFILTSGAGIILIRHFLKTHSG
jgi:hypothetical protein